MDSGLSSSWLLNRWWTMRCLRSYWLSVFWIKTTLEHVFLALQLVLVMLLQGPNRCPEQGSGSERIRSIFADPVDRSRPEDLGNTTCGVIKWRAHPIHPLKLGFGSGYLGNTTSATDFQRTPWYNCGIGYEGVEQKMDDPRVERRRNEFEVSIVHQLDV